MQRKHLIKCNISSGEKSFKHGDIEGASLRKKNNKGNVWQSQSQDHTEWGKPEGIY